VQKPADRPPGGHQSFRTLFLSDFHLATWSCQSERLLSFLRQHDADTIYLVGDIIDMWSVKRKGRWRTSQTAVLLTLLAKAKSGSRIVYIPGNHDSEFRLIAGTTFP
jgi:UDP-2,3-diacylglucosamine pyrophosphatase LpxH